MQSILLISMYATMPAEGTQFEPEIVNEEFYAAWQRVFDIHHSDATFDSIVRVNPDEPGHFLVFGYNYERERYERRTSSGCPFHEDFDEKEFGRRYHNYRIAINDFPPVRGLSLLLNLKCVPMEETEPGQDLEAWVDIAADTQLRIFANSHWGASQRQHQHAQAYPFRVPLEYFLQNGMENYPGENYLFSTGDIDDAARLILELREARRERTVFVIGQTIGVVPRNPDAKAVDYFGSGPSGGALLGVFATPTREHFRRRSTEAFELIWSQFQKTLYLKK